MVSIRRANATDFPAIRRLIHIGNINPTGLKWTRFIVAVDEEHRVIGCGQIKPHGKTVDELASLAVDPGQRGQGVARALIEHLLEQHPGALYLTCRASLEPFYRKFGFEAAELPEMPPYFRRIARLSSILSWLHILPENILVMQLSPRLPG